LRREAAQAILAWIVIGSAVYLACNIGIAIFMDRYTSASDVRSMLKMGCLLKEWALGHCFVPDFLLLGFGDGCLEVFLVVKLL
jgi:hypothetical protein